MQVRMKTVLSSHNITHTYALPLKVYLQFICTSQKTNCVYKMQTISLAES